MASQFENPVVSLIATVLLWQSPNAILGEVAFEIIFPFKLEARGTPAHVMKEIRVRIHPSLADLNSPVKVPTPIFG